MLANLSITAPSWVWLVPVWITIIICGTIAYLRTLEHRRRRSRSDDPEGRSRLDARSEWPGVGPGDVLEGDSD